MQRTWNAPCGTTATWRAVLAGALGLALVTHTAAVHADARSQAKRIHDRLAGVPPTESVLASMTNDVASGRASDAAHTAMQHRSFYDVTLKNFATPWMNRDQSVFAPLNDYVATVIGMVRDDVPFDRVLYDDVLYVGRAGLGLPGASVANNDHYAALESGHLDLKEGLVATTQSAAYGLPPDATAGVITSRAAANSFFVAGTNRAMLRFTLLNHLCTDLEQLQDPTRPPDRIRQDVSRSPGGDSRVFLNNCVACHSGMDPLAQAFAYYDFDPVAGRLVYTPGVVRPKYSLNKETFPGGYVTPDDRWDNYWRQGRNALLGWDESLAGQGAGAKSLGRELARSDAFAGCQAQKVFRAVCFRSPSDAEDRARVQWMAQRFKTNGYRLKQVFADAATYCAGD